MKKQTAVQIEIASEVLALRESAIISLAFAQENGAQNALNKARLRMQDIVAKWLPTAYITISDIVDGEVKLKQCIDALASVLIDEGDDGKTDYLRKARNLLNTKPVKIAMEKQGIVFAKGNKGGGSKPKAPETRTVELSDAPEVNTKPAEKPLTFSVSFEKCKNSEDKLNALINFTMQTAKALKLNPEALGIDFPTLQAKIKGAMQSA